MALAGERGSDEGYFGDLEDVGVNGAGMKT